MSRRQLTPPERSVVAMVSAGRSNPEIAAQLHVSLATVKRHLNNVMNKWDCENRTQVAVQAVLRDVVRRNGAAQGGPAAGRSNGGQRSGVGEEGTRGAAGAADPAAAGVPPPPDERGAIAAG